MIYNINPENIGNNGKLRNGDLLALINILQYLRKSEPSIQFHVNPQVILDEGFRYTFFNYLCKQTDFFSLVPGTGKFKLRNTDVWEIRDIVGDHVSIPNTLEMQKKVVVFPVYDAQYNTFRNWPLEAFDHILLDFAQRYPDHERIICAKDYPPPEINIYDWQVSTDLIDNIEHVMTTSVFIGGDTGFSHLASALDHGPSQLHYYYSSHCIIHSFPFYYLSNGKGKLHTFGNCFTHLLDII